MSSGSGGGGGCIQQDSELRAAGDELHQFISITCRRVASSTSRRALECIRAQDGNVDDVAHKYKLIGTPPTTTTTKSSY